MSWYLYLAFLGTLGIGFCAGGLIGLRAGYQDGIDERNQYCDQFHMAKHTCNVYPHPNIKEG